MRDARCPFCNLENVLAETTYFYIIRDRFPVNEGHTLAVLKRHEPSFLEITRGEWQDLYDAISLARDSIEADYGAKGFNIGVNVGIAAGQTVPHVHLHIIPRYPGDCESPGGGVRKVKPPIVDY